MADRLKGKVAFCTASGAGIGRATAIAFAREGARVIASDLNEARLAGLEAAGVAECVKLDVPRRPAMEAQAKRLGPVDVLFNAAGFVHHGTVLDAPSRTGISPSTSTSSPCTARSRRSCRACCGKGKGSIINIASTRRGEQGSAQPLHLWGDQGRRGGPDQGRGHRLHRQGHPLQLHLPRHHRDAVARGAHRRWAAGRRRGQGARMFIARQPMGRLGTAEEMAYARRLPGLRRVGLHDRARPSSPTAALPLRS